MAFWLIPLDNALPAVQAYLSARGDGPLDTAEAQVAAELLKRCFRTSEVFVAFALHVAGRPSPE